MRHLFEVTRMDTIHVPALAGEEQVCGIYTPTGVTKCVDRSSPKAEKIESVSVP